VPESGGEFCHAQPGFTPTGPYSGLRVATCGAETPAKTANTAR
jgi:hypothetical protein